MLRSFGLWVWGSTSARFSLFAPWAGLREDCRECTRGLVVELLEEVHPGLWDFVWCYETLHGSLRMDFMLCSFGGGGGGGVLRSGFR